MVPKRFSLGRLEKDTLAHKAFLRPPTHNAPSPLPAALDAPNNKGDRAYRSPRRNRRSPLKPPKTAAAAALLVMRLAPPPVILLHCCLGVLVVRASHVPLAVRHAVIGRLFICGAGGRTLLLRTPDRLVRLALQWR